MQRYCGQTAQLIDASENVHWVYETLSATVMRPLPDCEPRCPADAMNYKSDITMSSHETEECICYCSDEDN